MTFRCDLRRSPIRCAIVCDGSAALSELRLVLRSLAWASRGSDRSLGVPSEAAPSSAGFSSAAMISSSIDGLGVNTHSRNCRLCKASNFIVSYSSEILLGSTFSGSENSTNSFSQRSLNSSASSPQHQRAWMEARACAWGKGTRSTSSPRHRWRGIGIVDGGQRCGRRGSQLGEVVSHDLAVEDHQLDHSPHHDRRLRSVRRPCKLRRNFVARSEHQLEFLLDDIHDVLGCIRIIQQVFSNGDETVGRILLVHER